MSRLDPHGAARSTSAPPERRGVVMPSARDPIAAWLDVFVPLTGVRGPRAAGLRAELEDHLRSRVDDLLISGLSEPEAVRRAMDELGTTVELARAFRVAGQAPRRRRIMHAAIGLTAAAALAMSTAGWLRSGTTPTTGPSAVAGATGPDASDGAAGRPEAVSASTDDSMLIVPVQIEAGTVEEFFAAVAASIDAKALVAWETFSDVDALQPGSPAPKVPTKDVPLDEVLELVSFTLQLEGDDHRPAALVRNGVMTVATQEVQDARSIERREYDISWVQPGGSDFGPSQESVYLTDTIKSMIASGTWVDLGGSHGELRVLGSTMVVRMPARFFDELESLIETVRARHVEANRTRHAAAEAAAVKERDHREAAVLRVHTDYRETFERVARLLREIEAAEAELSRTITSLAPDSGLSPNDRTRGAELMGALRGENRARELELDEARARLDLLTRAMHTATYAPVLRALDSGVAEPALPSAKAPPGEGASAPPAPGPISVSLSGAVNRPGAYDTGSNLPQMLRRVLEAGGVMNPAGLRTVRVLRAPKLGAEPTAILTVPVSSVLGRYVVGPSLQQGDVVHVE